MIKIQCTAKIKYICTYKKKKEKEKLTPKPGLNKWVLHTPAITRHIPVLIGITGC